jgi:hypothetical protein
MPPPLFFPTSQAEIRALRDENFVLGQKLEVEHEQANKLRVATARLSSDMELGSERCEYCRWSCVSSFPRHACMRGLLAVTRILVIHNLRMSVCPRCWWVCWCQPPHI